MHSSHSRRIAAGTLAIVLLAAPAVAGAQGKGKDDSKSRSTGKASGSKSTDLARAQRVPRGHLPPPGQCRVWVEGTAPGQQAAPTDCRTAMEQAAGTENARVVVGRGAGVRKGGRVTCADRRTSYPTYAPLMRWGPNAASGTRARELRQWNIPAGATAAVNDFNGDGRPETVVWNVDGQPVQIWHNPDGDGSADIVEVFCNGTEVQQFVY